ncbi:hypothetical protein GCM10027290_31030 [Micromonospora sonneratiae]|uniref:Uncharacterized protein n=1 Tax=Micromonospora sonneratiae TaxID=1184706 RepID=A0ABW3YCH2_9ACTN
MRKLTDIACLLYARIIELAVEHHDQHMRSAPADDTAAILTIKTAVDVARAKCVLRDTRLVLAYLDLLAVAGLAGVAWWILT